MLKTLTNILKYFTNLSDRENCPSWAYSYWEKVSKKSKNFESYKVYIIKCELENERFFKIGKTFTNISIRYKNNISYNYKIVYYKTFNDANECSKYEKELQALNKNNKYKPLINFAGSSECFNSVSIDALSTYID